MRRRWLGCGLAAVLVPACSDQSGTDWWHMAEHQPPPAGDVETFVAEVPPPPLSGGTLHVTLDGLRAIVADAARDRIVVVELGGDATHREIPLQPGDEPGRIAEDDRGRIHVALRRGGAVVTVDPGTGEVIARRQACAAPRGIAHQSIGDRIHVACAGGELVSLPASPADGASVSRSWVDTDLRDVVVVGSHVYVSRFRTAELLCVDDAGTVVERMVPADFDHPASGRRFGPTVAWRTLGTADGSIVMLHQRSTRSTVVLRPPMAGGNGQQQPASYGSVPSSSAQQTLPTPCGEELVHAALTVFKMSASTGTWTRASTSLGMGALVVDLAVSPNGRSVAIGSVGLDAIFERDLTALPESDACMGPSGSPAVPGQSGQSLAYHPDGSIVAWSAEPGALLLSNGIPIHIDGASTRDTGWEMFHRGAAIACASCHPEGRDDGHVWQFEIGPRRTQNLSGGVLGTEPFHWDGRLADLGELVIEVMESRMGQGIQPPSHVEALAGWLSSMPALSATPRFDDAAARRGEQLFHDATVGCAGCHGGSLTTNNATVDVATGAALQVPSLRGLGMRAPYMHDGCAPTLHLRFGPCGGGDAHGRTSHLPPEQIDDLVAYLERL